MLRRLFFPRHLISSKNLLHDKRETPHLILHLLHYEEQRLQKCIIHYNGGLKIWKISKFGTSYVTRTPLVKNPTDFPLIFHSCSILPNEMRKLPIPCYNITHITSKHCYFHISRNIFINK